MRDGEVQATRRGGLRGDHKPHGKLVPADATLERVERRVNEPIHLGGEC